MSFNSTHSYTRQVLFRIGFYLLATFIAGAATLILSSCAQLPTDDLPQAKKPTKPMLSGQSQPIGRSNFKGAQPPIKSVILMIGDGMGVEHARAASFYAHGEDEHLFMHSAPYKTVVRTGNLDERVTDSAAAATAMATGVKVENRVLSLGTDGEPLETALEFFQGRCKSTGIVVSSYLNHATPAAFASHQPDRAMLKEIAAEMLTQTRPNLMLGGTAEGITAAAAEAAGYTVVRDRAGLLAAPNTVDYLSGQFSNGNMAYEYEHAIGMKPFYDSQPHLSEMTQKALEILSLDPDGFFLLIEGSRIDHAAHANALPHTIFEVLEFDKTVQAVVEWANGRPDVLVVVTADHETGGLSISNPAEQGVFPAVTWATGQHTGNNVPIFGWNVQQRSDTGAETESTDIDNTFIYELVTNEFGELGAQCDQAIKGAEDTPLNQQQIDALAVPQVRLPIMVAAP